MNIKINQLLLTVVCCLLISIYACTKGISTIGNANAYISWKTDTVTHHQYSCSFDTGSMLYLTAYDTVWVDSVIVSYWMIRFNKRPTQSGVYTVRGYTYNYPPATIPDSMVEISGVNNLNKRMIGPYVAKRDYDFSATGYNMPKVTVTIINGKIRVDVPPLWVYKLDMPNFTPPPYTDSIKVSGTMLED